MNSRKTSSPHPSILLSGCAIILLAASMDGPARAEEPAGPTFRIFSYPNTSWKYDEEMGQTYGPIWAQGSIVNGAFHSFNVTEPLNRYGNYGEAVGSYLEADVKIALFGSSFTAPKSTILFQKKLAEKLGKKVHVLNFSIGSNGFLSMFDVARVKVPEFKPDILLFVNNASAYLYSRIWRFNAPAGEHFWHFVQSFEPKQVFDPNVAQIHSATIITDLITDEWLVKMNKAKTAGDEKTLREDSLVKQMIEEYEKLQKYIKTLHEVYGPAHIALPKEYSYLEDKRFIDAVEYIKSTAIPFYMIHVPTHPEVKREDPSDYAFPEAGVPEQQGRRYAKELDQVTGQEIIHLVDYYDPEYLEDISGLFDHPTGGHPAPRGIEAMAKAFVTLLMEKEFKNE